MNERISSITGALVALCIFALIGLIVWFVVCAVRKKNKKISLISIGVDLVLIIIFTIIGSTAYSKTDAYQDYLAQKAIKEAEEVERKEREQMEQEQREADEERKVAEQASIVEAQEKVDDEAGRTKNEETEQKEIADTEPSTEDIKEEITEKEKFSNDFKTYIGEDYANGLYDILIEDVGFESVKFGAVSDAPNSYEIIADEETITATVIDDFCRIFIPNSDYVFYEDEEVKLTADEYFKSIISWENASQYYIIAKTIINDCITGNAKFPSNAIGMERKGGLVIVQGTVQGKNAFNATVEESWTVEFLVYDLDSWLYEPIYIKLGDETSGEYIKLEDWDE